MKEYVVHNQDKNEWSKEQLAVIRSLKLRYFTPTEIANILCFPSSFGKNLSVITRIRMNGAKSN